MCVNTCNEPPNIMVAIFIPYATISSPRYLRTTADCRPPYPLPNHTFLLDNTRDAERNSACVSSTDHGHLAQYGCDGTHKEAGRGRRLVEPTSLSLPHPVVWLWIWGTKGLQLGQEDALYADRPHDIGSHNNGEEEQASAWDSQKSLNSLNSLSQNRYVQNYSTIM